MKDKKKSVVLKKQINCKFEKLTKLREEMLSSKRMISGSLIKRYLGTKEHKRTSPAFYLSILKNGKRKLEYISKSEVKTAQAQVMEWKKYKHNLKRWSELTNFIRQDLKQLSKIQDQQRQK
ncbi:MAG: hypothetical protein ABIH09_04560 [Candidatus Omnitrophota bacterium]|nr:hypothetical protein [Candidatus Methanoperedenaceae archaeon]